MIKGFRLRIIFDVWNQGITRSDYCGWWGFLVFLRIKSDILIEYLNEHWLCTPSTSNYHAICSVQFLELINLCLRIEKTNINIPWLLKKRTKRQTHTQIVEYCFLLWSSMYSALSELHDAFDLILVV